MKKLIALILVFMFCFLMICSFAMSAVTYTGRIENISNNDMGVTFTVVVFDGDGKEILRQDRWVSTGVMTAEQAKDAIKNTLDRTVQEVWAHKEGIKEVMKDKTSLEAYNTTCESFVETKYRPSPQDTR